MTQPPSRCALISNRNSRQNRKHLPQIEHLLSGYPDVEHFVTADEAELAEVLVILAQRKVTTVAINGGDGTCSAVIGRMLESGLFPHMPRFVLLPGGTANMNAGDIGCRGALLPALKHFCEWASAARPASPTQLCQRRLLRVSTPDSNHVHYGLFLGAGAIILGTDYAHKQVHARGLGGDLSLALTTARTAWGIVRKDPRFSSELELAIKRDQGPIEQHHVMLLAASTLQRLAFGIQPFWGEGPGELRLTVIDRDCSRFGRTFPTILRGHPSAHALKSPHYHSYNAEDVTLYFQGKVNLDGELLSVTERLHIQLSQAQTFLLLP